MLGALVLLSVSAAGLTEAGKELQKYDINEDGSITISEVTALLNYLSSSCGHEAFTSIENYTFSSCNKLTSIVFNDTTTWYCTPSYSDWVSKSGGNAYDGNKRFDKRELFLFNVLRVLLV